MNTTAWNTAAEQHWPALQRIGLPLSFIYLGMIFATWSSRIPTFSDRLHMDTSQLSWVLLCSGLGAVLAFPASTWLSRRLTLRKTMLVSSLALLIALPLTALAPSALLLLPCVLLLGLGMGCFDVVANVLAGAVEKAAGRSIMSALHAWFCVGTVSGALIGSGMIWLGVDSFWQFTFISAVFAFPLYACARHIPNSKQEKSPGQRNFSWPQGPVILLAAIGFCAAMIEGSVSDWSGLYMRDVLNADTSLTPLGYASFAAFTLLTRLIGDRLKDRHGAIRILSGGAVVGSIGLGCVLLASHPALAIAGFALTGVGMAMAFPFVYSAAARQSATAMAGVATISYAGNLVGPPLIGHVAHSYGLPVGMGAMAIICLLIAVLTPRTRLLNA